MQLFYCPAISGDHYVLSENESGHAIRVLRLKKGDRIELIDGVGGYYQAEIHEPHHKRCGVKVLSKSEGLGKRDYYLHIGIAPTKNIDRLEWFLEKCTEIGIDEITPLLCEHSERKHIRHDRLEKVITAAMKQSVKAFHPKLNELTPFVDFLASEDLGQAFIAHCYKGEKPHLKNMIQPKQQHTILIGPEGDFSEQEVNLAKEKGFAPISLGPARLRTETAGIVACHTVALMNEGI